MPTGPTGWIVMLLSFALTFIVARTLGNKLRSDRKRKAEEKARAAETRQMRRARERRARG